MLFTPGSHPFSALWYPRGRAGKLTGLFWAVIGSPPSGIDCRNWRVHGCESKIFSLIWMLLEKPYRFWLMAKIMVLLAACCRCGLSIWAICFCVTLWGDCVSWDCNLFLFSFSLQVCDSWMRLAYWQSYLVWWVIVSFFLCLYLPRWHSFHFNIMALGPVLTL